MEERALLIALDLLDPRKARGRAKLAGRLGLLATVVWVRAVLLAPAARRRRAASRARHVEEGRRRISAHEARWLADVAARDAAESTRRARRGDDYAYGADW